jgi:Tfp pilus assembly protein PilE
MSNSKGVTLISIVVTITVLIILASITAVASKDAYTQMKFEKFKAKLEEVQKKVDEISTDYGVYLKNTTDTKPSYANYFISKFGTSPSIFSNVSNDDFSNYIRSITPSDTTFYFHEDDVKKYLGLKGIDDIIVDFSTRTVYSVKGCKDPDDEDKIYYTSSQYGKDQVVTTNNTSTLNKVTATQSKAIIDGTTMYQITLDVIYSSTSGDTNYPITKVYYSKDSGNTWTKVSNANINNDDYEITFVLYDEGTYQFKVEDSSGIIKTTDELKLN